VEERLTKVQVRLLEPTQLVVLGGVAALAGITWFDLWRRASEMSMHMAMGMAMPRQAPWDVADLGATTLMWGIMMIAMMLPSATPLLLLFARSQRPRLGTAEGSFRTGLLATGYLVVWLSWSGLGVYQLSPWKHACLVRCQSPLGFLLGRWQEGRWGAFRMGLDHGVYCVGCCWALMALLFVGGVMNLTWIAALAVFVLLEKAVVRGRWFSFVSGGGLVVWGLYVLRAGLLPTS